MIDPGDLLKTARSVLANFKIPKDIRVVDRLPRNAVGKVVKAPLKELLISSST